MASTGDFPIGTVVSGNIAHELGIWEKQSSMWFQAKTAKSVIENNIFFNGPRAGINFNDGFGGGDTVTRNLIFNTCRESGDHGPINSWDRQPYLTSVRTGRPSLVPENRYINRNFIVSNYHGFKGVDNDDGSSWYQISYNFMVFGWMHKSNFDGHSKATFGNIGAQVSFGMLVNSQHPEYVDSFVNNTIILNAQNPYLKIDDARCPTVDCNQIIGNNTIFTNGVFPRVQTAIDNHHSIDIGFENWTSMGYDKGTTLTMNWPSNSEIMAWAATLLDINVDLDEYVSV